MIENKIFKNISQLWANVSILRGFPKTANIRRIKAVTARGLAVVAVFSLVFSSFSIPTTQATAVSFVDVCHKTGNSYNLLSVNSNALSAHLDHGDVYPIPQGGCASLDPEPIPTTTIVVTGDTAAGENLPGWMFNRDTSTDTPFAFDTAAQSIGTGSLHILPISATASDKMIAENFINKPIADINGISYDFKIGSGGVDTEEEQFYMSVYANFGSSADLKYYDCRYSVVPTVGSTAGFTTVSFDPTQSYPVATRAGGDPSPFACPSVPADMDSFSSGSNIRMFALNVGDTSASDEGLDGYLDKVVVSTTSLITTYDFEPVPAPTPVTVNILKVWADSNGVPINEPDNKDDILITVGNNTCEYDDGDLTCSVSGTLGQPISVSETGVPTGWEVDPATVGQVTPVCNENNQCTHTIINKLKTPAPCSTELIVNGGFETPAISDSWDIKDSGTTGLSWSVDWVRPAGAPTIAKAELHRGVNGWNPKSGSQHAELDSDWDGPSGSNSGEDGSVKIFQDIPTNVGNEYTVSLWTSPRPGQGVAENVTRVKAGAVVLDTIIEDGSSNGNTVWTQHTYTFIATSSLTRLEISDQGTGNSLGGFVDNVSLVEDCSSDVTICKLDDNQNPLSGWTVFLKGDKADTVVVNSTTGVADLSTSLPAGDYVLEVSGTYIYRPGSDGDISDSAYSKRIASDAGIDPSFYSGPYLPWVRNLDLNGYNGYLGMRVNNANFDWGTEYHADHKYAGLYNLAAPGSIPFSIVDDNYNDNSGTLTVDIYPIIKGTTGEDGCVTLNNVDFDTYTLDELMKKGWSNVSGQGTTAVVNSATENFTLVNTCETGCTSTVTICKEDTNGTPLSNWTVMLKGKKLETVSVNSNAINGADSINALSNGQQYLVVANGTWQNRTFENVDARFTTPDGWTTQLDAPQGGFPNELLELQVNDTFVSWGPYSTGHSYSYVMTGTGATANFGVFDGDVNTNTQNPSWFGDNIGSLSVDIYPVYAGVTDDGCVTLENVPFGTYTLDEIMKDGWTNEEGKGDKVSVDFETESFQLVNMCDPDGCAEDPCVVQDPAIASGAFTRFEGLATSLPADLSDEANYPFGVDAPAVAAGPTGYPGAWDGPLADPDITEGSAYWVSNSAAQPTNPAGAGGDGSIDTWRLYSHTFTIAGDAMLITPGVLHFSADNEVTAYLDGVQVGFSNNFAVVANSAPLVLTPGIHTLKFAVKNWAFEPENNPTGLLYNFDFQYCGSETQQGEPNFHATGYKWNDDGDGMWEKGENGIEDWTVYLTRKLGENLDIPADSAVGVNSPILENGKTYLIRSSGTYNAGDSIMADSQYSERNAVGGWTDLVQSYEIYGPELLDLQIDGNSPNWGVYNNSHSYWTMVTGSGSAVNMTINDVYYPNNTGSLNVEIYEVITSTTTDSDGFYDFNVTGLDGELSIIEGSQTGWKQVAPAGDIHTVLGNTNSIENDFGNQQVCVQQDYKLKKSLFSIFADIVVDEDPLPYCGNGISGTKYKYQSGNEDLTPITLSGWVIYLDLDNDGELDDNEPYDTTDEDGNYSFSDLPTGTYFVREVGQEGWTQMTPADDGANQVLVTDSVVTDQDFTNRDDEDGGGGNSGFKIQGKVYHDNNSNNGDYNEGEEGLNEWVVYLDTDESNTLNGEEVSTTSDSNGNYEFSGLVAGCYTVREVLQSNWGETEPSDGEYTVGIGGAFCSEVTLESNTQSHWYDFMIKTASAAFAGSFPGDATGLDFGNLFTGGGGSSGGGGGSTGGGPAPEVPNPTVGRVLGDSTNIPSTPTTGTVLGATTELPRTGTPAYVVMVMLATLGIILLPKYIAKQNN